MKSTRPSAVLIPPLVTLTAVMAVLWWDLAGIRGGLGAALLDFWGSLAPMTTPVTRPSWAGAVEILLGLGAAVAAIGMILRLRLYWAGLFVTLALAAWFEASWFLYFSRHLAIDALSPGLGLFLVFLAGALARAGEMHLIRTRLRIAFSDSLPPASIEKIANRPETLSIAGETRTVTYLVCGVRRLAGLAAEYRDDPKGFTQLMSEVLSPLLDQALAHGGTIDRLTGDGFAAFWNAPLDDPGHALHACEAGQGMAVMAARVNEYTAGLKGPGGKPVAPLEVGVGIATGNVIAGGFGGLGRLGYSVNGEPVALATRIQQLSPQYGPAVIVSEGTRKATERAFAFLEVDYVAAGGDDNPVKLYALLGTPVARSTPKFQALATFHEHIFAALRGRQWSKARDLIAQCRQLSGASQPLYDLHLARIQYFENNPPGPEWDGAFRPVLK